MESRYITATDGRLSSLLTTINNNSIENTVPEKISKAVNDEKIRSGVITKFYPYLDKAEVKLDNKDKTVLCKILHRYGGEIMEFYTPLNESADYDDKLHEPYIVPRSPQHVLVINIHDADSEENLILGYYQNEEIVGYNPASPGNIKLMCMTGDNQYWIKFGADGLDYRGIEEPTVKVGHVNDEMEDLKYYTNNDIVLDYENGTLKQRLGSNAEYTNGSFKF